MPRQSLGRPRVRDCHERNRVWGELVKSEVHLAGMPAREVTSAVAMASRWRHFLFKDHSPIFVQYIHNSRHIGLDRLDTTDCLARVWSDGTSNHAPRSSIPARLSLLAEID